jgi:hypothetical protein
MHLEQVDDSLDPVNFPQQLLRDLLVVEGIHAALQNDDSFCGRPHHLVTQRVGTVLQSQIDSRL